MKKAVDLKELEKIISPADFYGWKEHIIGALKERQSPLAQTIEKETSLLNIFLLKEQILQELGLGEKEKKEKDKKEKTE